MNAITGLNFLVVEDDPVDVKILTRGLMKIGSKVGMVHKSTCPDALDFLREDATRSEMSRPFVILLDFNLPGMNAIEFLNELRHLEGADMHFVIVFTTSEYQANIDDAYAAGANAYIIKPTFADGLKTTLEGILGFVDVLRLPSMSQ